MRKNLLLESDMNSGYETFLQTKLSHSFITSFLSFIQWGREYATLVSKEEHRKLGRLLKEFGVDTFSLATTFLTVTKCSSFSFGANFITPCVTISSIILFHRYHLWHYLLHEEVVAALVYPLLQKHSFDLFILMHHSFEGQTATVPTSPSNDPYD